jgi:hypothetical protein
MSRDIPRPCSLNRLISNFARNFKHDVKEEQRNMSVEARGRSSNAVGGI